MTTSQRTDNPAPVAAPPAIGFFERYLTVWVGLCIVAGIALGQLMPGVFHAIAALEVARVNIPVGILIWVMIVPMLLKIDFAALGQVKAHARGIGVTLFINWAVKPFSMALLGWIFIRHLLAPWLPPAQIDSYIAGLILLAAAPCTAMVFVWSQLCRGDPYFTLSQVALNDAIMVVAFAPIVALLLGLSSIAVPWATLLTSVGLYIVVPVVIAQIWRRALLRKGVAHFQVVANRLGPFSIAALLLTLVLLFAFQGEQIIRQPLVIAILAVPILLQVLLNLVMNACDAMEGNEAKDRRLIVRTCAADDGGVRIEVIDIGSGLPVGGAERAFERFFTTKPHGLGLGLSVCKTIITAHGGTLGAANNSGRGVTFYCILPVCRL